MTISVQILLRNDLPSLILYNRLDKIGGYHKKKKNQTCDHQIGYHIYWHFYDFVWSDNTVYFLPWRDVDMAEYYRRLKGGGENFLINIRLAKKKFPGKFLNLQMNKVFLFLLVNTTLSLSDVSPLDPAQFPISQPFHIFFKTRS